MTSDDPEWLCSTCAQTHQGLATVFGPNAPDLWVTATQSERDQGELNADMCVLPIAGTHQFFLRGHIEIPVDDPAIDMFVWSVWVSLSETNAHLLADRWNDPERSRLEPMFGCLSNELPYNSPTTSLPTRVHHQMPGVVPTIELDPAVDHALVREQVNGITIHRLAEINRQILG